MSRETILILLGALIVLSPWSGLPLAWLSWILPILGIGVIAIALTLRSRLQSATTDMAAPIIESPTAAPARPVRTYIS